jgi:hypothetical protein
MFRGVFHLHRSDRDLACESGNPVGGAERSLQLAALLQRLTRIRLMYCTWLVAVNLALGYERWIWLRHNFR